MSSLRALRACAADVGESVWLRCWRAGMGCCLSGVGRSAGANSEEAADLRRLWLMLMSRAAKDPRYIDDGRLAWAEFQLALQKRSEARPRP